LQAQQFHVCHMFLYNYYEHLRPKYLTAGGKTIDWAHISDPTLKWTLIPDPESTFLFTKHHKPAQKELVNGVTQWAAGFEPDEQVSTKAMTDFLKRYNVPGMAAPGQDRCGEPCCCGGHASKHITGLACDVSGMAILGQKILSTQTIYKTADEAL